MVGDHPCYSGWMYQWGFVSILSLVCENLGDGGWQSKGWWVTILWMVGDHLGDGVWASQGWGMTNQGKGTLVLLFWPSWAEITSKNWWKMTNFDFGKFLLVFGRFLSSGWSDLFLVFCIFSGILRHMFRVLWLTFIFDLYRGPDYFDGPLVMAVGYLEKTDESKKVL